MSDKRPDIDRLQAGGQLREANLEGADLRGATLEQADLDEAILHGVDARGATLLKCSLGKVEGRDVNLGGAALAKLNLVGARLEGLVLDGASLDDVGLLDGSLVGASLVGARISDCVISGTSLEGCDLTGTSVETSELRDTRLIRSTGHGLLLRRCRLRGLALDACTLPGCVAEGCRGLGRVGEEALSAVGATIVLPPAQRAFRKLRGSRPLQIGLVVLLMVMTIFVILLLRTPSWWPTSLLYSRFEDVESRNDLERCEPLLELGGVLLERDGVDRSRKQRFVQRMAECEVLGGRPEEAQALLRHQVELAVNDRDEHRSALGVLGRFLVEQRDLEAAQGVVEEMEALADLPHERLEVLRFQAELLTARGHEAQPGHPDDPPVDPDPWRSLQLSIADTLEAMTELAEHHLESTPRELYVVGEWERADTLLAAAGPEVEEEQAWQYAKAAVERLLAAERADLATALVARLREGVGLDSPTALDQLRTHVSLLARLGQPELGEALLDAVQTPPDPSMAMELELLRAEVAMDAGRIEQARILLEATTPPPDAPFDRLARHGWLLAEARLLDGDEAGAAQALEPLLRTVPDKEQAEGLLQELVSWMGRLEDPGRVATLLESVENPMLQKAGQGQELALTSLRARARDGSLSPDDPALLAVLERGTVDQMRQAAGLLLDVARRQGTQENAIDTLLPRARKLSDARSREGLGLMLADAAMGAGQPLRAVEIVRTLDLADSDSSDTRSRALGLEVTAALKQGELDRAHDSFVQALTRGGGLEDWVRRDLGHKLVDALQRADRWQDAMGLARRLLALDPGTEPELRREIMACAVALGDGDQLEAEIRAASAAGTACQARTLAARAWMDLGKPAAGLDDLSAACSQEDAEPVHRLAAASALGHAGLAQAALDLVQGIPVGGLAPALRLQVVREHATWLAATGDKAGAAEVLERGYASSQGAQAHERLTDALVSKQAAMGDAAGVASSYRRFVEDHPTHDSQALWKNAAETLIRMGHQDMLEGLGGQSGWLRLVQDAANQARFQQLLEQQAHDEAWAWLDGQLEREEDQDQRASLLQKAGTLADRSGQHGRLMVFLDALERDLPESSELAQRTRFRRAQAMAANDRGAEAAEQLGELLAVDLPPELRRQALQAYGRTLGRQFEPADIESRIAALGTGGLTTAEAQELRHRAARQLLERGEPMGALTVLERLVDQPLESDLAEPVQEVLIRANVASGELDAALRIPLHYPSTDGSCQAWLFLVQNLPGDRPQAAQARDGALAACQPGKISVDKALILAGALAAPQPEQALAFLDSARQAPGLLALDRAKLDVQRAQVLASQGEFDQARVALQGILDQTDEPRIATRACAQLVRLARQETDSTAAEQASSTAQACVDRVESNRPAVKEIVLETVATLRALEAYDQAVVWQRRLVDAQPEPSEDRGYALLQLVHVELDAAGGDPSKADPSWLDHMAEAKGLATPDTHLHGELTTLELAWQVLQAHKDEARLADTLERAIVTSENGSSLLNSVAARLDAWKAGDAAKQVRAERGRRYPG